MRRFYLFATTTCMASTVILAGMIALDASSSAKIILVALNAAGYLYFGKKYNEL